MRKAPIRLSRPLCVLAGVLAMMLAQSAIAEGPHHRMGKGHAMPKFTDIDLDGDGAIVASEFYEARGKHMAERAKAGGKMKNAANAPSFEDIDTDDNGEVSPEEFAAHQADMKQKHRCGKAKKSVQT